MFYPSKIFLHIYSTAQLKLDTRTRASGRDSTYIIFKYTRDLAASAQMSLW